MATQKRPAPTKKTAKSKKKPSLLARVTGSRYGKPALFAIAFMLIGVGAFVWASAATTTQSLWSTSTVPKVLTWDDTSNIELGTKFKTDVAGYVTGVRFYKGPQNTGTHTGSLWDSNGKLLSQVTFTNETSSGWQTATFAQPIGVASGVTYVVSYHAPKGHYSLSPDYFKSGAHVSGHLTAPKFSASAPNGVYTHSNSSAFPKTSGDGDSYFVDILFTAKLINPQPAPAAPAGLTGALQANNTSVDLAWNASVSQNPISQYTVYRDGNKLASVGTNLTYTDRTIQAGKTYNYQIQAVDNTGVSSALSNTFTASVPSDTSGGGTGGTGGTGGGTTTGTSSCPLPAYPNPSCTGRSSSLGYDASSYAKTVGDGYTITAANTVVDNWHVTGTLVISAPNVVIKNSQIDGTVYNDDNAPASKSSYTISDSSVGPSPIKDSSTGKYTLYDKNGNMLCNAGGLPSLNGHDFTATRVYLYGNQDGIDPTGDNVTVSDSLVQPCFMPGGTDGYHSDGVQDQCGGPCGHFTFTHDTFDSRAYYNNVMTGNSAFNVGSPNDGTGNNAYDITVRNSMMLGGSYTTSFTWNNVGTKTNWIIDSNVWVSGTWEVDAAPTSAQSTCSHQTWTNNSIVTIDSNYNVTKTLSSLSCLE